MPLARRVLAAVAILVPLTAARAFAAPEPVVLVTDAAALAELSARGYGLGARLGGAADDSRSLGATAAWASVARVVSQDLDGFRRADRNLDVGLRTSHRLFDPRWLTSPATRLGLVALALRFDRRPFAPTTAGPTCGELRFIYRLGYGAGDAASRLPMTVNLTYWLRPERAPGAAATATPTCEATARRWLVPPGAAGAELARVLLASAGGLGPGVALARDFRSLEVNLQSVRWPSTVRPDMGGHAEYLLRAFHRAGGAPAPATDAPIGALEPAPLENTPDVERLARDRKARADLLAWILDPANRKALDDGIAVMPERFAATRAVSVAPLGFGRRANRPFARLFRDADVAGFDGKGLVHATTARALLRRLDGLTCAGCHQSRSVAGFHVIGADDPARRGANHIAVALSPHVAADLPRRRAGVAAWAAGKAPDERRSLPERVVGGPGPGGAGRDDGYGAHCGLGDAGFAAWTCGPGLRCVAAGEPDVGHCLPVEPGLGDPCAVGVVRPHDDPHRDGVGQIPDAVRADAACGPRPGVFCESNRAGFPGGLCAMGCDGRPDGTVCGGIPALRAFNDCLARKRPFEVCIAETATPRALRACSETSPCRDDHLCARTADGGGACLPPYFLFQMRVDGHGI